MERRTFWSMTVAAFARRAMRSVLIAGFCLAGGGCLPGLPGFGVEEAAGEAAFAPVDSGAPGVARGSKGSILDFRAPRQEPNQVQAINLFATPARLPAPKPSPEPAPRKERVAARPQLVDAPIAPLPQALGKFYAALSELAAGRRTEPLTILHIGDDHVATDLFTSDLRAQFQSRFGDAGRGMLPPGVFGASGVKFDRGGTWSLRNSSAGHPGPFGITGVRMEASSSDAWVRLTNLRGPFDWLEVSFATGPGYGTAIISVDGEAKYIPTAAQKHERTALRMAASAREIVVRPRGDGPIALLSFTIGHERPGVRYVSLGLPGATIMTPGKWNIDFMVADIQKLQPDLIVLGYGTREGFIDSLETDAYQIRANILVQQLKELAPQAAFLLIGPPDVARLPAFAAGRGGQACRALNDEEITRYRRLMKREDERLVRWHAPPKLDEVRHALRNVASAHGAYFWDWSRMMGGACSIHAWVHAKPPLAAPDHVMLTARGAERSARALFIELMNGFEAWKKTGSQAEVGGAVPTPVKRAASPPRTAEKPSNRKAN